MSTLRERMDGLRGVFTAQVPAEIKAVMSGATEDLCASDILERLPIPGSPLPAVELPTGQFAEFINQESRGEHDEAIRSNWLPAGLERPREAVVSVARIPS